MSNPVQQASQVPLHELLLSVPADARLTINEGEFSTRYIPVGRLCHEAADALFALQSLQGVELPPLPERAFDFNDTYEMRTVSVFTGDQMQAYARTAIAAHLARQAVPQGYAKTVIEALYENGDPVSVDAAELLQSLAAAPTPEASQPEPSGYICAACQAPLRAGYTCDACGSDEAEDAPEATQPTQAEAPSDIVDEFAHSKFASTAARDMALLDEIERLRAAFATHPAPEQVDIDEVRRALCVIGVVGQIDGYDVIRRDSVLSIIDRRIDAAREAKKGEA